MPRRRYGRDGRKNPNTVARRSIPCAPYHGANEVAGDSAERGGGFAGGRPVVVDAVGPIGRVGTRERRTPSGIDRRHAGRVRPIDGFDRSIRRAVGSTAGDRSRRSARSPTWWRPRHLAGPSNRGCSPIRTKRYGPGTGLPVRVDHRPEDGSLAGGPSVSIAGGIRTRPGDGLEFDEVVGGMRPHLGPVLLDDVEEAVEVPLVQGRERAVRTRQLVRPGSVMSVTHGSGRRVNGARSTKRY